MTYTVTVILRGTERYHMEKYLTQRGYHQEGTDGFIAPGIRIVFSAQRKVPLGSIYLTEVEVNFEGDYGTVEAEAASFRLQFLTAGG